MEKLWKILENIGIVNLPQKKEEVNLSYLNQISYCKVFHQIFISNRNEKAKIFMNNPVYLGLSILELSKTLMCEFLYDYVKPKYGEKAK